MKILHLTTFDNLGGAARGAFRLHQGLKHHKIQSWMLVQRQVSLDPNVVGPKTNVQKALAQIRPHLDALPLLAYPERRQGLFSPAMLPDYLTARVASIRPDIVHLHWVAKGFLRIETLKKIARPILWTLHDMWAFTGGCHYSLECNRFQESCGNCPALDSKREKDLSRWIWNRKDLAWRSLGLIAITPSRWLGKCARSSLLFRHARVEVIPNGIDVSRYKPLNKMLARQLLGLPQREHLILFGADSVTNPLKGFDLLLMALEQLGKGSLADRTELIVFGAAPSMDGARGFRQHYMGILHDDIALTILYSAADVFVAPSRMDNLPQTVMEALACGTPCVAFAIGGMPDMIEHKKNGYLAQPEDQEDLARGIAWILQAKEEVYRDKNLKSLSKSAHKIEEGASQNLWSPSYPSECLYQKLCDRAREKVVQEFDIIHIAQRYEQLYREIAGKSDDIEVPKKMRG